MTPSPFKTWSKSLENRFRDNFGRDVSTPAARRRAWWDFQLMDHAFFRVWWTNFAEIAPGVYRSNQPGPNRVRAYAAMGIKTIINLRGTGVHSHYLFERQACAETGIALIDHRLYSANLAPKEEILALYQSFLTAEKPFVMHCKSGADRAGLAAALYLMLVKDVPSAEAKAQLHPRYLHFRSSATGALDFMLEACEKAQTERGISALDWIKSEYEPEALMEGFRASRAK